MARYIYTPTTPESIGRVLGDVFATLEGAEESTYNRSANANTVAVVSSVAEADKLEAILDEVALVQPSRFFVVLPAEIGENSISVGVSARCHGIAKGQHVCSEVIRISVPLGSKSGFGSILRAQFLTGAATDMLLLDGAAPFELISSASPLCDGLVIDSVVFAARPEVLRLLPARRGVVDLAWIGLGPWRDAVRIVFERHAAADVLPYLRKISLQVTGNEQAAKLLAGLLLGWISARLKLSTGPGLFVGRDQFTMGAADGTQVATTVGVIPSPIASGLQALRFEFAVPWGGIGIVEVQRRGSQLEITVDLGARTTTHRPADDDTVLARLRRHFLIGESLSNYAGAAERALALLSI